VIRIANSHGLRLPAAPLLVGLQDELDLRRTAATSAGWQTMSIGMISLVVTAAVAVVGYYLTYWNNLRLARHQARLTLVNERIDGFYGPLFIITRTMSTAYQTQLAKSGRKRIFQEGQRLSQTEWDDNYAWVVGVYAPLENDLSDLITHKAHLLREQEIPASLMTLVAHVAVTKALLYKWAKGDYSELYPAIDFPYAAIEEYAQRSYAELKAEQLRLLG
jgi:hypothetical protein